MLTKGRSMLGRVSLKSWRREGISSRVSLPNLKRNASNSLAAIKDTYFSTKQVFENHRVVFTIGTSVASVLTAWAGYSLRHVHQNNVEKRLDSIENAVGPAGPFFADKTVTKCGHVANRPDPINPTLKKH